MSLGLRLRIWMKKSGVALETTRELMRHKSIDTTIKHYTLITEQEKNEALNALTKI